MRQFKRREINSAFRSIRNQEESKSHDIRKSSRLEAVKSGASKVSTNSTTRGFDKIKQPSIRNVGEYRPIDILIKFKFMMKESSLSFYSTSKLDQRYARNIKMLQDKYSNQEILDMFKFLIESEQQYLDKKLLHPGILLTGWSTKIKTDTEAYLKGEYKYEEPYKNKDNNNNYQKTFIQGREYSGEVPTTDGGSVGEWK